jgi:hypothetical protein
MRDRLGDRSDGAFYFSDSVDVYRMVDKGKSGSWIMYAEQG